MKSKPFDRRTLLLFILTVMGSATLAGCHGPTQKSASDVVTAKIVEAAQSGDGWRHSDVIDPVKDPANIAFYYRIERGEGDQPLRVTVRFDGVTGDDAQVQLRLTDGARFASDAQSTHWQLPKHAVSELSAAVRAPKGYSYLVLDLRQNGKSSTRPISLRN